MAVHGSDVHAADNVRAAARDDRVGAEPAVDEAEPAAAAGDVEGIGHRAACEILESLESDAAGEGADAGARQRPGIDAVGADQRVVALPAAELFEVQPAPRPRCGLALQVDGDTTR